MYRSPFSLLSYPFKMIACYVMFLQNRKMLSTVTKRHKIKAIILVNSWKLVVFSSRN